MDAIAFTCLSLLTAASALGMVVSRNAVNGAMLLLIALFGIAGLFIELHAYLLAVILILVYAGAIVALFLFIIMLLDMQGGLPLRLRAPRIAAGVVAAALLVVGLDLLAVRGRLDAGPPAISPVGSLLKLYAYPLFTTYMLPVQVMGFLLLIAMLGVIVISRRLDKEDAK